MAGVVIADAGPLIALATVDRLGLLQALFGSVQVADPVRRECLAKASTDARRIDEALRSG